MVLSNLDGLFIDDTRVGRLDESIAAVLPPINDGDLLGSGVPEKVPRMIDILATKHGLLDSLQGHREDLSPHDGIHGRDTRARRTILIHVIKPIVVVLIVVVIRERDTRQRHVLRLPHALGLLPFLELANVSRDTLLDFVNGGVHIIGADLVPQNGLPREDDDLRLVAVRDGRVVLDREVDVDLGDEGVEAALHLAELLLDVRADALRDGDVVARDADRVARRLAVGQDHARGARRAQRGWAARACGVHAKRARGDRRGLRETEHGAVAVVVIGVC